MEPDIVTSKSRSNNNEPLQHGIDQTVDVSVCERRIFITELLPERPTTFLGIYERTGLSYLAYIVVAVLR